MKRIISFITVLAIVVSLLGCNVQQINQQQNYINENIITDTIIQETFITEKAVSEIVLEENVIEETYLFEHFITEDIIAESLIFEVTVGEDTADILLSQLPNGIEQYNIDIDELLTKFAIGTTIVIVAGVVTGVGLSTPAYYLFASVATTTIKEAIIGAVSNSIVPYINNDKTINDEVKKYAIEGAVDGYMWGAISGFAMSLITGFSYSTPSLLSDEDNELSRLIEQYESVMYFDEKPNYHARKVDDVSYLINEKGEVVNCYDDLGNTIPTPNKSEINRITTIQKNGRYSSKFGVKNGIVYSNNQEIGRLNEALEIVGTGKYEGQLIGTIGKNISNKKAILIENNWRAIQSDIRFDSSGKIVNSMSKHFNEGTVDTLTKKFNIKIINDIYSKENGKKIAYIIEKDGKKFLMNNSENKILGIINQDNRLTPNWNQQLSSMANSGVTQAQKIVVELIQNDVNVNLGPSFTDDVIKYVKENNALPSGFQGHHINNVANYPFEADNPNNIIFYSAKDHLEIGHNGNFQNSSSGNLMEYTKIYN